MVYIGPLLLVIGSVFIILSILKPQQRILEYIRKCTAICLVVIIIFLVCVYVPWKLMQ